MWWRQSWFSLNGTMGIQGKKGALSYATQLSTPTNRSVHHAAAIRRHINVFVEGKRARLDTRLAQGADVFIVTAISGG
jgi:hypothetical protein